jgi:hypothetical protein
MAVPDGWPPARASGCTEPGLQASSPAARPGNTWPRTAAPEWSAMAAVLYGGEHAAAMMLGFELPDSKLG